MIISWQVSIENKSILFTLFSPLVISSSFFNSFVVVCILNFIPLISLPVFLIFMISQCYVYCSTLFSVNCINTLIQSVLGHCSFAVVESTAVFNADEEQRQQQKPLSPKVASESTAKCWFPFLSWLQQGGSYCSRVHCRPCAHCC